jgi:two-component system chemotaxis response regulator CheB
LAELTESVEKSLWNAIRAVEERARLLKHLAEHAKQLDRTESVALLAEHAEDAQRCADLVRQAALLHEAGAKQQ